MKILTTEQSRALDAASIQLQNITSHELMERAAKACSERLLALVPEKDTISILSGNDAL
ncbi:MAG: bifunctional ADP-dependent NAD(P)H-hydrate dehydratase/NAD(P)H-hydrate epimerase, partial [Sphingobacteriia bacterium]|nr:bifunctional ADP-dependent NAD(P)H-hydrate dehydratase/NAD(P)H-hydrate epimerase [Sphingobacteriia bacterium]